MTTRYTVRPIGHVECSRSQAVDDRWDAEHARIVLDPQQIGSDAVAGLEAFSHLEVIYVFDRVPDEKIARGVRRPRGNPDWPEVGILAQRGKNRPNRLGATICEVLTVDGLTITVRGLDAIDASPVLDVKPVLSGFLPRTPLREPDWAKQIMADYW